jgi:Uma2 family endonuclease
MLLVFDAGWLDAARLSKDRISGALDGAPNLVVEIVSPTDRWSDVIAKVGRWLKGGAELVWVIDPATRSIAVHRADGQTQTFGERESLDGGDVLKGFKAKVRDLFPKQK